MHFKWLNLQLLADGGAAAGAAGTAGTGGAGEASGVNAADAGQRTGVNAADAGQREDRLKALGVPADKIARQAKRHPAAYKAPKSEPAPAAEPAQQPATATEQKENTATEEGTKKESKPSDLPPFEEILKNPDYNKQIQSIVKQRLKDSKDAEDRLSKLTPVVELMASRYEVDPADPEALLKALEEDRQYYENRALESGLPVEVEMKMDKLERENARMELEQQRSIEDIKLRAHFAGISQQEAKLKEIYPNFDLNAEMQNPVFRRMVGPDGGVPLANAYYAMHHDELTTQAMETATRKAAENFSKTVQAGQQRPVENGTIPQASSQVPHPSYKNMTAAEKKSLKDQMKAAWARGEKFYLP